MVSMQWKTTLNIILLDLGGCLLIIFPWVVPTPYLRIRYALCKYMKGQVTWVLCWCFPWMMSVGLYISTSCSWKRNSRFSWATCWFAVNTELVLISGSSYTSAHPESNVLCRAATRIRKFIVIIYCWEPLLLDVDGFIHTMWVCVIELASPSSFHIHWRIYKRVVLGFLKSPTNAGVCGKVIDAVMLSSKRCRFLALRNNLGISSSLGVTWSSVCCHVAICRHRWSYHHFLVPDLLYGSNASLFYAIWAFIDLEHHVSAYLKAIVQLRRYLALSHHPLWSCPNPCRSLSSHSQDPSPKILYTSPLP